MNISHKNVVIRDSYDLSRKRANVFVEEQALQEQAGTVADRFAFSVVSIHRHLVALVEAQFSTRGTRADSYRVEMPNETVNFWNFQISAKNDSLERLTEIFETNFRKLFCSIRL